MGTKTPSGLFTTTAMTKTADISACGRYRYSLSRIWGPHADAGGHCTRCGLGFGPPHEYEGEHECPPGFAANYVGWIMLNPSIADADIDDNTIRKCMAFAKSWGYDGIIVRNLFNLRATDPRELYKVKNPIGERSKADDLILSLFDDCQMVIAAWGAHGSLRDRDEEVIQLTGTRLHYLRLTKYLYPAHPLYLPASLKPVPWERQDA